MKFNVRYVILGSILLLITLLSMSSGCGFKPYSSLTRSYAIVEGAETKAEFNQSVEALLDSLMSLSEDNTDMKRKISDIRNMGKDGYDQQTLKVGLQGLTSDKTSMIYTKAQKFIDEKLTENQDDEDDSTQPPVVEQNTSRSTEEEEDTSQPAKEEVPAEGFEGKPNCATTASGLSNSMGPICLTTDQMYMLQTRGGNATTGQSI